MKKSAKPTSREGFNSSFGVLMALAGSAVGLGNMWRFPYLVGENGGAAFIIIYLVFVFFIGLPIMMSEFIIGRKSQANAAGAFKVLAPGSHWSIVGVLGVICCILILSFYSVVGGWSLDYFFKSCALEFTRAGADAQMETIFSDFVASPVKPLIFHTLFLLASGIIVVGGVKNGIEKFSKLMMPILFIIIILIAIRSLTLPGAKAGIDYLFKPDFSKVTSGTFLSALGQAFFSLSLGSGMVITYASYAPKNDSILSTSAKTVAADTIFAIIAGCAIMPAVFSFGIDPSSGPGLVFVTLPHIFSQMPLGGAVAILFFATLLLAALTSSISLLEVITAYGIEELKMSRKAAIAVALAVLWVFGCLCSLSQGVLSDVKLFGMNIFDLFDYVSANILMLAGGLLVVLFVGWKLGKSVIREEIPQLSGIFNFLIKFIAPLAILAIAVSCNPEPEPKPEPEVIPVDLSAKGTANCYIVSQPGTYKFDARVKGNSTSSIGGKPLRAEVLWESFGTDVAPTKGDLVKNATYDSEYITFSTPETLQAGNAVIALRDAEGYYTWSWHIWIAPGFDPVLTAQSYGGSKVMDRNLGATSADPGDPCALGLLYEWGRKDPFLNNGKIFGGEYAKSTMEWPQPVESSITRGTISYAVHYPTTFIKLNPNNDDWLYSNKATSDFSRWTAKKGTYDPCPPGWKVPSGGDDGLWTKAIGSNEEIIGGPWNEAGRGMEMKELFKASSSCWYPAAGHTNTNNQNFGVGTEGCYWSCTPYSDHHAYCLYFSCSAGFSYIYPSFKNILAKAYSVRCVAQ